MNNPLENIFTYKGGNDLPEGAIRLSGSNFATFVTTPWKWHREHIQGLDKFEGSTSSVLGTCVHLAAECYELGISHIQEEVNSQLCTYGEENPDLELDLDEIMKQFPLMANALVEQYLKTAPRTKFVEEGLSWCLQAQKLYAQGSVDRREGTMVVDYKTFNSATDPKSIPSYYRYQLLFYAWLYKQQGVVIDRIRLVYISRELDTRRTSEKTGKPIGKITPARTVVLTDIVEAADLDWVDSMIDLWVKTMKASKQYPELLDVIWHAPMGYLTEKGEINEITD